MRKTNRTLLGSVSLAAICATAQPGLAQDGGQDLNVESGPEEIEEIVVRGIRGSLRDALRTKRNADAFVDAISAEDIGKFPDKNIAESLQRVPGVVTNREFGEGERVSLRGLAPNQTKTLINGHAVATADWFVLDQLGATRNFNYLVMPSDIVGELQVFKSPRADMEEGGIGGTVNVLTRKPLDLNPLEFAISAESAYTARSDSFDPQISGIVSWHNEAETFGVLAAGVFQEREIRRDGFEILGFDTALDPSGQGRQVPSLIGSALFQQERERIGANVEIQFRPTDRFELNISGLWTRLDADNTNANFLAWPARSGLGGDVATLSDAQVEDNTIVAGTINNVEEAGGFGQVFDVINRVAFAESRFIAGDATFEATETLRFHAKVGYTSADGDTTQQPFVEFLGQSDFSFDISGSAPVVSFESVDPTNPEDFAFEFASNHQITNDDEEVFVYFDVEKDLETGPLYAVKAGFKFTDHKRETDFQATTFGGFFLPFRETGCGGGCSAGAFGVDPTPDDFAENIAAQGSLTNFFLPEGNLIREQINAFDGAFDRVPLYSEIFSIDEESFGGYVLGNFEGEFWRGNAGLRIVTTEQISRGFIQNAEGSDQISNAFGVFLPVTEKRRYTEVLPSINMVFDLQENLLLRFAAARSITRPDFTDIAPRVTLNPGALTGSGGNPDVKPFQSNQFDVALEWYPYEDAIMAASFYFKDIGNFISDEISEEVFSIETMAPDPNRCEPAAGDNPDLFDCSFSINRRANAGGAEVQGVELIAQLPLAYGFGFNGNYAFADAEADSGDPVPGNSTHSFQIGGYYEDELIGVQLNYNWRDDFFITFDRATQLDQEAFGSLDFSLNVHLTEWMTLTASAVNLTNEKIRQFAGSSARPRAILDNGRYFFFGGRVQF